MSKITLPSGLNVHYERVGTGPDLVMVHGIGGNMAIWHFKIVPMLWARYQTLTYDLRGHGYTQITPEGYTPTQLATDLKDLLDELNIESIDLVGHSYGADIALYFCYLYPERVRKAVLVEAMVPALAPSDLREELLQSDWVASTLEKLGIKVEPERRLDTEYMIREAMKLPNKWGPLKGMPAQWTTDHMIELYSNTTLLRDALDIGDLTRENISLIKTPIRLIYDSDSEFWRRSFEFLEGALQNVSSAMLMTGKDEIAHFAPLEKPELIVEEILNFLTPDGGSDP